TSWTNCYERLRRANRLGRPGGYPAEVSYAGTRPSVRRRIRKVGAPLGVIIALGTIVGLLVIGETAVNPVGAGIAFVLSTAAMTIVLLAYAWLDRWEPEPSRLLVLA